MHAVSARIFPVAAFVLLFAGWGNTAAAATFQQSAYGWLDNTNSTRVDLPLARQDGSVEARATETPVRLRLLLHIGTAELPQSGDQFKLQFSEKSGECDTGFVGESYEDVTATSTVRFFDNPRPTDGIALEATRFDPVHGADTIVNQTYEEANNFTNSQGAIGVGEDGKWDFPLAGGRGSLGKTYCLRAVKSDGSLLGRYAVIPEIAIPSVEGGGGGGGGEETGGPPVNFFVPGRAGTPLGEWTNPLNVRLSDDVYATVLLSLLRQDYFGFGFAVPSGNQVIGIEVRIEASAALELLSSVDVLLSWNGGTTYTSAKSTGTLTTTDSVVILGGATDTWGRSWAPDESSDTNFRLRIGSVLGLLDTLRVDQIAVRVYHQASGGGGGGGGEVLHPAPFDLLASVLGAFERLVQIISSRL